MKKCLLSILLATAAIQADEIENFPIEMPEMSSTRTSFPYLSMGVGGIGPLPLGADVSFGRRKVDSHHVWDVAVGGAATVVWFGAYGQASYLYFPEKSKGFYLGAGLTAGVVMHDDFSPFVGFSSSRKVSPFINLPLTFGHQFAKKGERYSFIQCQVTPVLTSTISYGLGF